MTQLKCDHRIPISKCLSTRGPDSLPPGLGDALQEFGVLCDFCQELLCLPERLAGVVLLHVVLEHVGAVGAEVAEAALCDGRVRHSG